MRNLTRKQKRLLTEWYEENKDLPGLGVFDVYSCDEFSGKFMRELREIHDTEILTQNIDRFISDLAMKF
jgi:hypothetical protein